MSTTSMNISLPEELKDYVETQTKSGYGTPSEFVRELIRAGQKRRATERLDALLLEGLDSGEPIPVNAKFWAQARSSLQTGSPQEIQEMTDPVTQRSRARLDLLEQFVYFGEEAGVAVAERYFAAVDESCRLLVKPSKSGTRSDSSVTRLEGMRRFPVRGFDNYLILKLPRRGGIDVIRVLHGARDIDNIFVDEENG